MPPPPSRLLRTAPPQAYYNDTEPFAVEWLKRLDEEGFISHGVVDASSIKSVESSSIGYYKRVHLFAGIGGWERALYLAGWPVDRPVWTGSCPCQPFSRAGKGGGVADDRHLWPEMFRLVRECRPQCVFGEQVESAVRHGWLDGISADLEGEGYTVGAAVLGAHSVGAPHLRQRLYWVAHRQEQRLPQRSSDGGRLSEGVRAERVGGGSANDCDVGRVGDARCERRGVSEQRQAQTGSSDERPELEGQLPDGLARSGRSGIRVDCDMGHSGRVRQLGSRTRSESSPDARRAEEPKEHRYVGEGLSEVGFWSDYDLVPCLDGKARRVEPGTLPLAHGVPNRVGLLRGYGNAIVPQTAALFVRAFLETEKGLTAD